MNISTQWPVVAVLSLDRRKPTLGNVWLPILLTGIGEGAPSRAAL